LKGLRLILPRPVFTLEFTHLLCFYDEDPPKPGQVYVTIVKEDPVAGIVEWSRIQKEGDRLGWSQYEEGPTSTHRVFSKKLGKIAEVDFDTKALLSKIQTDKLVLYESRHCPILKRPMQSCPGPTSVRLSYKVNEVSITTEGGSIEVLTMKSGPGPLVDSKCPAHGGNGQSPKWSEEQLGEFRAQEAQTLLWQAENGWLSKNPKVRARSRDAYRKLLKEYPTEAVVVNNRERIKARSEAEIED